MRPKPGTSEQMVAFNAETMQSDRIGPSPRRAVLTSLSWDPHTRWVPESAICPQAPPPGHPPRPEAQGRPPAGLSPTSPHPRPLPRFLPSGFSPLRSASFPSLLFPSPSSFSSPLSLRLLTWYPSPPLQAPPAEPPSPSALPPLKLSLQASGGEAARRPQPREHLAFFLSPVFRSALGGLPLFP